MTYVLRYTTHNKLRILGLIFVQFIISPNEVFGDIMVLASRPRTPVDPDDVNALIRKIFNESQSSYEGPEVCCY